MKHFWWVWGIIALAGCAPTQVPAPVYNVDNTAVKEKPEPKAVRPQTHTIKSGDTLASIALEYGLDYRELALWNGLADPDTIYAGNTLRLSPPAETPLVATVPAKPATVISSATPSPTPAPKSTLVKSEVTAEVAALAQVPIKTAPQVEKYAYSAPTLKKLRAAHATQKPSPTAAPQPPLKPVTKTATTTAAPQQVRRRFEVDWSWPAAGAVTRKFNEASKGLDIAGTRGAAVYAAADGKVVYVGSGVKSYGRLVIIKHKNDYLSAYAHNEKIIVREGQKISRGQQIAAIGDSGAAQVMLHIEVRKAGKPFDPLQVLPPQP